MMNMLDIAKKVLQTEADAVQALISKLDDNFTRAVDVIYSSRGRVVVTGMGKSGLVGKKIAATLASTGTPAFFMHPAEATHGDLGMVTSDDVIIAISNSGETDEIVSLMPFLKRFSVSLISMTGNRSSSLARGADVTLDISVSEEACPMGIVPTASTTATLAMGDALAIALLTRRGFREEDFAFFHPSGSLGKKLFIQVKDLMHSGEMLPLTQADASLTEAIIEISSRRLGVTAVIDDGMRVLGIVTDGDVRRGIEKWGKSFLDKKVLEVMTTNPKLIREEELAAKALAIMEKHSITSLVVADDERRIRGIIHMHDVLRQGIA
jgi:arabinose-5-phosphate isomerase